MCCGTESKPNNFSGCCGVHSEYTPRFMTRDQQITKLEKYRDNLLEEAKAVEEHIAQIKNQ